MQPMTDTAVRISARKPNFTMAQIRAGIMAMMTSSMMVRVFSAARMWGEEVAISFRFL